MFATRETSSSAEHWSGLKKFIHTEKQIAEWAEKNGKATHFVYEFIRFGIKQAWACLFGALMLALLLLTYYFYPRDSTPGCTTEACDFRDNLNRLGKLGINVVGISKDDPKSHQKFTDKQSINFPLISDETGEICESYGVWQEKVFMGRKGLGIVRTTFLLDSSLKVLKVYEKVKVKGHVDEILNDLKELIK